MTEETKRPKPIDVGAEDEGEMDLLKLARVIWKGKKIIICIVVILTLTTAVAILFMPNIYTVKAILKPVASKDGSGRLSSLTSQFGGIAGLAGITMPSPTSATEIVKLLESNILRKNIIERYNLLPVLFPDKWDEGKKSWKKNNGISLNPLALISKTRPLQPNAVKKEPGEPDTWDGIRALEKTVKIYYDPKEDIITITVNFRDPDMAAGIANYFIASANDHMSSEAKRIAGINKDYLEKQLRETKDNLVQQKIYNLIAEKIETMMMAEVKENFAFKVLDPPMVPDLKSKPKRVQIVIITFIASLFLSVFVIFFREYFKKIKAKAAGGHYAE